MFRFFRKLRQQLLTHKQFKKYALYAIGEILLVVIGILIALQANSWREEKKRQSLEQNILLDLRSEIHANINHLSSTVHERESVIKAGKLILEKTGPNAAWDSNDNFDSLLFKIVLSGWKFFPESGVVTDLLNSGKLNVIQNDSLRYLVSSLPTDIALLNDEDDSYRMELHGYIAPFFSKNYAIRDIVYGKDLFGRNMTLGLTKFETTPKNLLRNQELEGVLTIQAIWTNTAIGLYKVQLKKYHTILNLINQELEQ